MPGCGYTDLELIYLLIENLNPYINLYSYICRYSFLLNYVGIDGVTFILEHTIAQQLLSNGLAACSLINYQGRGLATSELTLRQHTPGRS